jgi:acetolactate synthase-1/2/3 large subunit
MTGSDLLVKCLEREGVEYIFGVPGEENADFMMSLEKSDKIRFILTRHEQGAAFMAEAYGRLTGNPAGCLGTLGPGATNLITGVADANMDRAPMLVLTGQGSSQRLHKESHQVMDAVAMFEPVTKWATSILHPNTIPEIVRKAVRLTRTEKPGAVHIELPEDIAKVETDAKPMTPQRFRRSVPEDAEVDRTWATIKESKRPVILAGNGCIRKRASAQLRALCERTGIGVVSTFMAKGAVDMDADYSLFTIGLGSESLTTLPIRKADCVICIGFDMVEHHPRNWNPDGDKCVVHIDFLPAEIDEHYNPHVEAIGDVANTLEMLIARVDAENSMPNWDFGAQHKVREAAKLEMAEHAEDDTEGSIRPQKALWDARQAMRPGDILFSDVGAHKMWIAHAYHCHLPNTCIIPNGFCSMASSMPGAIAANLVHPDRRILAICGDAGFMMNVQEMETAHRIGSNIVVMVWEDGGYELIKWKQYNQFQRHTDLDFGNPDWLGLAKAFGWNGYYVEKSRELRDTLETAFEEKGPSLVVIPIDYRENYTIIEKMGDIIARLG